MPGMRIDCGDAGRFGVVELGAVNGEGRQLDRDEPVAPVLAHEDANRLAGDIDHDGARTVGGRGGRGVHHALAFESVSRLPCDTGFCLSRFPILAGNAPSRVLSNKRLGIYEKLKTTR